MPQVCRGSPVRRPERPPQWVGVAPPARSGRPRRCSADRPSVAPRRCWLAGWAPPRASGRSSVPGRPDGPAPVNRRVVPADRCPLVWATVQNRRASSPGSRFHVKQGRWLTRSRVDRRTCRRHAPVIPARFGWSVRAPVNLAAPTPAPRSVRLLGSGRETRDVRRPLHTIDARSAYGGRAWPVHVGFSYPRSIRTGTTRQPTGRTPDGAKRQRRRARPPRDRLLAAGRAGPTIRSRTISTTVVGGSMTPTPQR